MIQGNLPGACVLLLAVPQAALAVDVSGRWYFNAFADTYFELKQAADGTLSGTLFSTTHGQDAVTGHIRDNGKNAYDMELDYAGESFWGSFFRANNDFKVIILRNSRPCCSSIMLYRQPRK